MTSAAFCDWTAATNRVAAQPHCFGGERRICYHAITYGFLVGELIRRADGRGPRQFLNEEVLAKVGADFLLGLSSYDELRRIARPAMPPGGFEMDGMAGKLLNSVDQSDAFSWPRACAENLGGTGFGNGRAIALACGIVGNNGVECTPKVRQDKWETVLWRRTDVEEATCVQREDQAFGRQAHSFGRGSWRSRPRVEGEADGSLQMEGPLSEVRDCSD